MLLDKAVSAVKRHVSQSDFEEAVGKYFPDLFDDFDCAETYEFKIAYALAACQDEASGYCAWYNDLWHSAEGEEAREAFNSAYGAIVSKRRGAERLVVEIELPDQMNGGEQVEQRLSDMIAMFTGQKPVALPVSEDRKKWQFEFDKVDSRRLLNLIIRSVAVISGVVSIVEQSDIPLKADPTGWLKRHLTLGRMTLALIMLIVGVLTGQVRTLGDAQDILDGTPLPTIIHEETPTPEPTVVPTTTPSATPTEGVQETVPPPTSTPDDYPVPTPTQDPYP